MRWFPEDLAVNSTVPFLGSVDRGCQLGLVIHDSANPSFNDLWLLGAVSQSSPLLAVIINHTRKEI